MAKGRPGAGELPEGAAGRVSGAKVSFQAHTVWEHGCNFTDARIMSGSTS